MPALTHGRVKNGFNLLPRTITYAQGNCDNDAASANQNMAEPTKWQNEAKLCPGSQRALCCGRPLQYTNMGGMRLYRNARIPTGPANRKFASTVSVGRSFAAKRAIARRTANCHPEHGTGGWTATFKIVFCVAPPGSGDPDCDWPTNAVYKRLGANPLLVAAAASNEGGGVFQVAKILVAPTDSYTITNREETSIQGWRAAIYSIKANLKKLYSTPRIPDNFNGSTTLESLTGNPPNKTEVWYLLSQVNYKITGMTLTTSSPYYSGYGQGATASAGLLLSSPPIKFKQRLAGGTKCCCLMPTVTYSQPVNAYRNPCSGGLAKNRLLIPCTNPTSDFEKFKKK